jgi:hypothetical protein
MLGSVSTFAQIRMEMSANYNIPISTDFKSHFQNGFGGTAEVYYYFNESNFSGSFLLGFNSFRGSKEYEKELADSNPTIFDYDYEIHFFSFPIIASVNYTFFRQKKFNLDLGFGAGVIFSEEKKKLVGKYTSGSQSKDFSEFAIYPSLGVSYEVANDIAISLKGSYNQTFGTLDMSYFGLKLGILYDI